MRAVTIAALTACGVLSWGGMAAERPSMIAVADFGYQDSSGEMRDQTAGHAARLHVFDDAFRQDLQASAALRVIRLPCAEQPDCAENIANPTLLAAKAKAAGASLLAFGGIHKMSTLVQFAKLDVVDLRSNRVVFERLYTFRGDSEDAWQHAERFVAREAEAEIGKMQHR
jgi:hypothetical protein